MGKETGDEREETEGEEGQRRLRGGQEKEETYITYNHLGENE